MTSGGSRGKRVRGGGFRRTKEGTAAPYDGEGSPRKDAEGEAEVKGEGRPGGSVTEAGWGSATGEGARVSRWLWCSGSGLWWISGATARTGPLSDKKGVYGWREPLTSAAC